MIDGWPSLLTFSTTRQPLAQERAGLSDPLGPWSSPRLCPSCTGMGPTTSPMKTAPALDAWAQLCNRHKIKLSKVENVWWTPRMIMFIKTSSFNIISGVSGSSGSRCCRHQRLTHPNTNINTSKNRLDNLRTCFPPLSQYLMRPALSPGSLLISGGQVGGGSRSRGVPGSLGGAVWREILPPPPSSSLQLMWQRCQ